MELISFRLSLGSTDKTKATTTVFMVSDAP